MEFLLKFSDTEVHSLPYYRHEMALVSILALTKP